MFKRLRFAVQDAATVARIGYQGFKQRRRIVIPGLLNKLQVQSVRIGPRRLVARLAAAVNHSKRRITFQILTNDHSEPTAEAVGDPRMKPLSFRPRCRRRF